MHRAQAHGAGAKEHHGLPSFGRAVESEHEMREAVSSYTARPPRECGEKGWRRRGLSCLQTNKHKPAEPHYFLGRTRRRFPWPWPIQKKNRRGHARCLVHLEARIAAPGVKTAHPSPASLLVVPRSPYVLKSPQSLVMNACDDASA